MEEWRNIKDYDGLYQVSNLGMVKSLNFNKTGVEKILKIGKKNGYAYVTLYKKGTTRTFRIHRLVATTFIPNPDNKPDVNHIDGNKDNNSAINLEWVTKSENQLHAWKIGLNKITEKHIQSAIRNSKIFHSKKIAQYDKQGNFIKEWVSIADAEKCLKIPNPNIVACCKGKRKTAGGYLWRYRSA